MIEVKRGTDRITIKGHAGYADAGNDIVCAAVSALAQTLIRCIEDLTETKIEYDISSGWIDIKHGILSERASVLIESFFIGVYMAAEEYPDCVKILSEH